MTEVFVRCEMVAMSLVTRLSTKSNGLCEKQVRTGARLACIFPLILVLQSITQNIRRPWRLLIILQMTISQLAYSYP